jgi:nitroreductase
MHSNKFIPYIGLDYSSEESSQKSKDYFDFMNKRRSVREFSSEPIAKEVVENIIMTASTAPSGAHKQPWTFCLVGDPALKTEIRKAAEKEEFESYNNRMSEEWLEALAPLGTDWNKPFLEDAPWLIIMFKKAYDLEDGVKSKNYYVNESIGIAAGFLLSAIHNAGFVSLTHTPSPMNFLHKLLNRPENERAFLLVPIGYPADKTEIPDLERKAKKDVIAYYE